VKLAGVVEVEEVAGNRRVRFDVDSFTDRVSPFALPQGGTGGT